MNSSAANEPPDTPPVPSATDTIEPVPRSSTSARSSEFFLYEAKLVTKRGTQEFKLACFASGQERVDGAEESFLIALGEAVDGLEATEEAAVEGDRRFVGLLEAEELVGGDLKRRSEPSEHVGMGAQAATLVVGDDGLSDG